MAATLLAGCATYQTPGGGVNVAALSQGDDSPAPGAGASAGATSPARGDDGIAAIMRRQPAASFPAHLALARVQSSGYTSRSQETPCYGYGAYCVVLSRDVETEADLDRLGRLPQVAGVALMNRLLLPESLSSLKDLRLAAANLRADMLLVYSLDTRFRVESGPLNPLAVVSLGLFASRQAQVSTTASAVLYDVRTGFVYGVAESTATDQQHTTVWSTETDIEHARLKTEATAFHGMLDEFARLWPGIVAEQARKG